MMIRTAFRARIPTQRLWTLRRISSTGPETIEQFPRIKIIRPILWSTVSIFFIYIAAANWEVTSEARRYERTTGKMIIDLSTPPSLDELTRLRIMQANAELKRRSEADISIYNLTDFNAIKGTWISLTSVEKTVWTAIGINASLFLAARSIPGVRAGTFHLPMQGRSWTLLTSCFGHSGPLHLFLNMYVLQNFALPVSTSRTFQGSPYHLTAFYLSSGILSCLAYHLQSLVRPMFRVIPCLGASGAIYAMLGAFGMTHADATIGIVFLPFTQMPAQQALLGLAAFELYGTIFGTRLGLAHIAHLTGLATGAAYVQGDAGMKMWKKLKQIAWRGYIDAIATMKARGSSS